jgi:hypothetical protein
MRTGLGELERARDPVVDVREAAGSEPVAPHLDLGVSGDRRDGDLAADRCGRLLASTVPCSVKAIGVVVSGNSSRETEVLKVFTPLESVVALHYFAARAGFNSSERASLLGVSCAASCGARRASVTS